MAATWKARTDAIKKGTITDDDYKKQYGDNWEYEKNRELAIVAYEIDQVGKETGLAKVKVYAGMAEVQKRFMNLLGDRDGKAYLESVVIAVTGDEKLQKCSAKSIMIQAMRAASLKLSVDKALHQAHLVPFGSEATLIVDYHGLVQLSTNTGYYEIAPNVFEVFEGEIVRLDRFSGKVTIEGERVSDKIIGWCGYFKGKNGTERYLYMTNDECDAHGKKYNPAGYGSPRSAWNTDRAKMHRKTVLRQLVSRWGNFSPQVQSLMMSEEPIEGETMELPSDENIVIAETAPRSQAEILQEMTGGE